MLQALLDTLFNRSPTPDRFAELFIRTARAAGYAQALDYDAQRFRLDHGGGTYFNLHNAFESYLRCPRRERKEVLRQYVATLFAGANNDALSLEQARPLLRPVIRNRGMLEEIRLSHVAQHGWESPCPLVYRPLAEDCVELLAVDHPDSTATLTQGPPEEWGISLDEALAIAHANLREESPDAFEELAPGVFHGIWQDGYDSSRALLPDLLQRLPLHGQPVFMLPNRDVLLVTGDRDEQGLQQLLHYSEQAMQNGRCISAEVFTFDDRRPVPFPLADVDLRERQATLRRLLLQGNYAMQKEFLDVMHQARGEDLFVANYLLYQQTPGRSFSISTWTRDVETSLPRTDRIALVMPSSETEAQTRVVDWGEAEALLGPLLQVHYDLYPPRYRTLGFPSDAQLASLTPLD